MLPLLTVVAMGRLALPFLPQAGELAVFQKGCRRKIAIELTMGVLSAIAFLQQLGYNS
jgi:hypothetical protein